MSRNRILAVMFKTTSHNCFFLKSTSSLTVSNSQGSQVTECVPRAPPLSPSVWAVWQQVWGSSAGTGAGTGPVVCGADTAQEWWAILEYWTLLLPPGHVSLSLPLKETDSLPEEPTRGFFCFVWAVCFLLWLCFLMAKAASDTIRHLTHIYHSSGSPLSRSTSEHLCLFF